MDKIDSEEFDAKRVFEGLLKTQTLKNLVQTNLEIQAEIKSLDHDVQSLVFENYSKFISSIDVVKKMREEVEKTQKDLDRLTESVDRIKRYTGSIDETLKPKRAEIQRLDKINKDLSNLKVLCELPIMLKEDLKQLHAMDLLALSAEASLRGSSPTSPSCCASPWTPSTSAGTSSSSSAGVPHRPPSSPTSTSTSRRSRTTCSSTSTTTTPRWG